jgi:FKBP-type peptidyl-prolyl cis-trans isomerase SlyD
MQVSKNKVVTANYVLKDTSGVVLDASSDDQPMAYLHGSGEILEGLEKVLEGKKAGDTCSINLKADDAYGQPTDDLIQVVDKAMFSDMDDLEVGTVFHAETDDGVLEYEVVGIDGDKVTIDGNHPLAGEDLSFEIEISEVRDATEEELEHGHAHGDGCDHD